MELVVTKDVYMQNNSQSENYIGYSNFINKEKYPL